MFEVQLEDFPRGSEFNLGRLGTVRAYRNEITRKPYALCDTQEQVNALKRTIGGTGVTVEVEEPEESPNLVTHDKTIAQVKVLIEKAQNREHLVALQESELTNPKYPGGRPNLLKLIKDQLEIIRNQ